MEKAGGNKKSYPIWIAFRMTSLEKDLCFHSFNFLFDVIYEVLNVGHFNGIFGKF